jgi:hypothetical protein
MPLNHEDAALIRLRAQRFRELAAQFDDATSAMIGDLARELELLAEEIDRRRDAAAPQTPGSGGE